MEPEYVRVYRDLHERHWWWRARRARVLAEVRALAPAGGFGHVLDVGCGDGLLLGDLARFGEARGVEPDASAVDPRGRHRDRIHVGPFDASYRPGVRFGLVTMLDVLEHLDEPVAALRHVRTLLAPEGRLLLTVPASPALWTRHDELNHHRCRYTRSTLTSELTAAGLAPVRVRHLFQLLVPVKLLARAWERLRPAPPRPPRVPPAPVNRALLGLARAEQALLAPLRPPFGSSLLVVARSRGDGDAVTGA